VEKLKMSDGKKELPLGKQCRSFKRRKSEKKLESRKDKRKKEYRKGKYEAQWPDF